MIRNTLTSLLLAAAAWPGMAQAHVAAPLPVGTCINAGNHLEPEKENGWGGKRLDAEDFRRIRAAGFTTVRIPVRWLNKSTDAPPHSIDPVWMARVSEAVDAALAANLNVILNSHHFEIVHDRPAAGAPWLADVWRQIARNFADRPNARLWFEIENEPHAQLNNAILGQTLVPALAAIRESNPVRPVIVGGQNWSGIDSLATLDLPDDSNIHPTFHYYDPFDFTHQGADWTGPNRLPLGRKYGTEADKALLGRDVAKLKAYIARTGMTPFMGETGAYDKAPLAERIAYHTAVREAFAPTGIGMCAWAYTNTFPFWDQKAGRWLPGLRAAFGLPEKD